MQTRNSKKNGINIFQSDEFSRDEIDELKMKFNKKIDRIKQALESDDHASNKMARSLLKELIDAKKTAPTS